MKKLALAGLLSILAVIALSGCAQTDGEKVMKGKYLTTPYSGDLVIFTPDDDKISDIGFTNVEESFEMLGLTMGGKDCESYSGYSGEATVAVGELKKNEGDNSHMPTYAAELLEVIESSEPLCSLQ